MEAFKKMIWAVVILSILLLIPLIIYFFFLPRSVPSVQPPPSVVVPETSTVERDTVALPPAPPEMVEPDPALAVSLSDSDEPIRGVLGKCSHSPLFRQWLQHEELIRRFVGAVQNIAEGVGPGMHLDFLAPGDDFKALMRPVVPTLPQSGSTGGDEAYIYMSQESYKRYDGIAEVVGSIDPEQAVAAYRKLQASGLLEQAYSELGQPDKRFDDVLRRAMRMIRETPLLEGEIQLEKRIANYAFADPSLENLPDVQKHLLRMGPKNIKIIRDKLTEIEQQLDKRPAGTPKEKENNATEAS